MTTENNRNYLEFNHFNFKLAVINMLMYELEILEPKLDVWGDTTEILGRKVDPEEEGHEIIKDVENWYRELQIPGEMAESLTAIYMDGGADIYMQIWPFWGGTSDYFDLDEIDEEEIRQFPNLEEVTLLTSEFKKVAEVFESLGIEVDD